MAEEKSTATQGDNSDPNHENPRATTKTETASAVTAETAQVVTTKTELIPANPAETLKKDPPSNSTEIPPVKQPSGLLSFAIMLCFLAAAFIPFALSPTDWFKNHLIYFGVLILGLLALACVLLGWIFTEGCWQGILIDRRNMMSLSKLQILIWTLLAISGYVTIAASRMGYGIDSPLDVGIPESLWALMGISTASFIGSAIIKGQNLKPEKNGTDKKQLVLNAKYEAKDLNLAGTEMRNDNPKQASFSDLFRGEEVGNFLYPDLGKIQMFLFTLIVWAAYAMFLYQLIIKIPDNAPEILQMQSQLNGTINATLQNKLDTTFGFPDVSGGMTGLLAISNAGYLAFKAVPREQNTELTEPAKK